MPLCWFNENDNQNQSYFIDLTNVDSDKFSYILGNNTEYENDLKLYFKNLVTMDAKNTHLFYSKGDMFRKKTNNIIPIHLPRFINEDNGEINYRYLYKLHFSDYYIAKKTNGPNDINYNKGVNTDNLLVSGKYLNISLNGVDVKKNENISSELSIYNYKELYLKPEKLTVSNMFNNVESITTRLPFLKDYINVKDISGGSIEDAFIGFKLLN
tara:strand:- start:10981 stop:11616 length:636 start_codon:yes stop_codon:yes gene_type:complete